MRGMLLHPVCRIPLFCLWALLVTVSVTVRAQGSAPRSLLEITHGFEKQVKPSSSQVSFARSQTPASGITVTIQPGSEEYPGIHVKPEGAAWNLAAFGHVEARVVNTGAKPLSLALRVDDAGDWKDNPTNTESVYLPPGGAGTVKVIFGYSYGYKPAYPLNPAKIVNLVLFAQKSESVQSFRIESLVAAGPAREKPPVAPEAVRIAPKDGMLLGQGTLPAAMPQIVDQGAKSTPIHTAGGTALQIVFPSAAPDASITVRPPTGRWDLRDFLAVRVTLRNTGNAPVSPRARVESNGGMSPWTAAPKPLLPGQTTSLIIPFAGAVMELSKPETTGGLTSDAVSAVAIGAAKNGSEARLQVEAIQAFVPAVQMPPWLGKRPPVPGAWVQTLDEEFTGSALNGKLWSVYGANYWDKTSHWSRDNVLLGNGVVKLRYQKKQGFNNDDPKQPSSGYASGYLHTYDKWAQRYGYFEARMKLPTTPGLWPAFWLMPDRGNAADPQWKRQNTAEGGMEFDILEHLTRWGPHRYNIAMHWDGYDKDHKSLGTDKIYMQTDKEGFVTAGLLWTPGSAVYYCNGCEVLRWENPRIASVPAMLMFTLPMGGWDNSPLEDARLPADFIIDYVRVWQRKDLASNGIGKAVQDSKQRIGVNRSTK